MEMHQIRYFLAVAETLNFTRAAEECRVAQSSLSRAVRKLEEELGGDLFRRERSRTHLTDLGREMLPLLRQAFDSAAAAKEQAASYGRAEHAPLRLGISRSIHVDVIAPMLAELSSTVPGLVLHLLRAPAAEMMAALEAGEIELGIAADARAEWDRLDRWALFEEGYVLLAPPDRDRQSVALSAIDVATIIERPYCETLPAPGRSAAGLADGRERRHAVSSDEDAAGLVRQGLGVAVLPESTGRLLAAPVSAIEDFDSTRTVRAYAVAGRRRSVAASTLLTLLRAADWSVVASV